MTSAPSAPTPDEAQHPRPEQAAPSTAVVRHEPLSARISYAKAIAAAGNLLPRGVRDGVRPGDLDAIAGRVFLIHETGDMLGIHPVAALQGVNVIEGKPTLAPALMTALVRRAGHRVRTRVEGTVAEGNVKAVCEVRRSDDPEWPFTAVWDLERAARAGLITIHRDERTGRTSVRARSSSGKVLPWEAYTEAMLKARAIGEACRDGAEDVLFGVHYTPEELGALVDEDGEMIGEVVDEPAPQQQPRREQSPAASPAQPQAEGDDVDDAGMLTSHLYGLARKAMTAEDLTAAWTEGAELFKRTYMAQGQTFGQWAAERTVDVKGRTVSLRDLFAELGQAARQAAAQGARQQGQDEPAAPATQGGGGEPENGPQAGVYAPAGEDVVDAEVEEDPIGAPAGTEHGVPGRGGYTVRDGIDPEDPWAQGGAGVPAPGVEAVAAGLGGEVLDVEGEGVTDAEVKHEQAKAARAREGAERQAPPQPKSTPPRTSGREAFAKAKEEVRRKSQEAAERGE